MKTIIAGIMAMLLLVSIVNVAADDATGTDSSSTTVFASDITIPETETTSVTPDKPLVYGLNRAIERIQLALTLNKAAKAEKGLKNAEQRLLAIMQMIQQKKLDKAEKAVQDYKNEVEKVKERIKKIKNDKAPKNELKDKLRVMKKLEELENNEDRLETTIQIKVFGNLSESEQEKVDAMIQTLQDTNSRAVVWMNDEITGARVKIKTTLKLSDKDVDEIQNEYENTLNLKQLREKKVNAAIMRLETKIEKANENIAKLEEKGKNVSLKEEKVAIAEDLLEKLKAVQEANGTWSDVKEAVKEARMDVRNVYMEKQAVRTANAAAVISNVIEKLQAKQDETGKNLSNAIAKLTIVQQKLETKVKANNSITTATSA